MRLGPWDMLETIGAGAAAQVWRVRHVESGQEAALKLIADPGRSGWHADALEEARLLAAVDHPHVIDVLDYGTADVDVDGIPTGSVWIATELAEGSMTGVPMGWPELRTALLQILSGLARVHAVGVIHRDIKPGNVLRLHDASGRSWKLADFGLAWVEEPAGSQDRGMIAGTPAFMAPEQIAGEQWRQGPWTDLYSVGCLGWLVATGRGPHDGKGPVQTMRNHMRGVLPAFHPVIQVPDAFGPWLSRLLQFEPRDRFRRAADARELLMRMPAPGGALLATAGLGHSADTMAAVSQAETLVPGPLDLPDDDPAAREAAECPTPMERADPLALHHEALARAPLVPLGPPPTDRSQALARVRSMPLVGRHPACDDLWDLLAEAVEVRASRIAVLHGPSGTGRSRLLQWLCQHAHETGLATIFQAPSGSERLGGLVRSAVGSPGLSRRQTVDRLAERLGPRADLVLQDALMELAHPEAEGPPTSGAQASGLLTAGLAALAQNRIGLVVVDDLDDDPDLLAWVRSGARWIGSPLVFVVVLTDGVPGAAEALRSLREVGAREIQVQPLDVEVMGELLRGRFGLGPSAAALAARHAGGSPAVAVELVHAWWEHDLLRATPAGWEPQDDIEGLEISLQVTGAWRDRLGALIGGLRRGLRLGVAVAGLLGSWVDEELWKRACAELGTRPPWDGMHKLTEHGVLQRSPGGWAWVTEAGRVAITRLVRTRERRQAAEACARVLPRDADPILRGQLLTQAGLPEQAIPVLLDEAELAYDSRRLARALAALDAYEAARRHLGRKDVDEDQLRADIGRCWVALRMGRTDEARRLGRRIEEHLAVAGTDGSRRRFAMLRAVLASSDGQGVEASLVEMERLVGELRKEGKDARLASALHALAVLRSEAGDLRGSVEASLEGAALEHEENPYGWSLAAGQLARLGELDRATELVERALEGATSPHLRAQLLGSLGHLYDRQGDPERGRAQIHEAFVLNERYGDAVRAADALNNMAEIDRRAGRLEEAEAGYLAGLDLFRRVGMKVHPILRANLALVYVERGAYERAREVFEHCVQELRDSQRHSWLGLVLGLAQPAVVDDPELADAWLAERAELLERTGHSDPDVARMMVIAADRWAQRGDRGREHALLDAARREAEVAHMPALLQELSARLASVDGA